jgi:hypothetical protein
MGMSPITYLEIKSYAELMGLSLSSFEIAAIKKLDLVAIKESNKE